MQQKLKAGDFVIYDNNFWFVDIDEFEYLFDIKLVNLKRIGNDESTYHISNIRVDKCILISPTESIKKLNNFDELLDAVKYTKKYFEENIPLEGHEIYEKACAVLKKIEE